MTWYSVWSSDNCQSFLPIYKISRWAVCCQPFSSHTWGLGMEQSIDFLGRDPWLYSQQSFSILDLYYPLAQSCPELKEGIPLWPLIPHCRTRSHHPFWDIWAELWPGPAVMLVCKVVFEMRMMKQAQHYLHLGCWVMGFGPSGRRRAVEPHHLPFFLSCCPAALRTDASSPYRLEGLLG